MALKSFTGYVAELFQRHGLLAAIGSSVRLLDMRILFADATAWGGSGSDDGAAPAATSLRGRIIFLACIAVIMPLR
jgi:hypothetical protein